MCSQSENHQQLLSLVPGEFISVENIRKLILPQIKSNYPVQTYNHKIVLHVSIVRFLLLSFGVFRIQERKRQVLFISTAKPNNHLAKYFNLDSFTVKNLIQSDVFVLHLSPRTLILIKNYNWHVSEFQEYVKKSWDHKYTIKRPEMSS